MPSQTEANTQVGLDWPSPAAGTIQLKPDLVVATVQFKTFPGERLPKYRRQLKGATGQLEFGRWEGRREKRGGSAAIATVQLATA